MSGPARASKLAFTRYPRQTGLSGPDGTKLKAAFRLLVADRAVNSSKASPKPLRCVVMFRAPSQLPTSRFRVCVDVVIDGLRQALGVSLILPRTLSCSPPVVAT